MATTFLELLRIEFDGEMKKTRKMLECVPEDKFGWKPHEKSMLLGKLASHVADIPQRAAAIATTDELVRPAGFVPFNAASKIELLERFEQTRSQGHDGIAKMTEDQLPLPWRIKFGDQVILELPKAMALRAVVMDHLIHHRAQLGVYLRLLDVPIPGMFGPSADERR
ncbi:MAG TPA: DinB family protein [Pseudacidobacterium sp.]|nr:DinB family protein [Pseudacidobacterium sp.]